MYDRAEFVQTRNGSTQVFRNPELDKHENGVATVFSVKEDMWHREGIVIAEAPSRAKAMELAGHNFEVETRPLEAVVEVREGETINLAVPDAFATVRTDRNKVLGVVGRTYTPLQNADAFATLDPILEAGIATLETGGTLREGKDVWMQVRLSLDLPGVFNTGEVVPFLLVANNHSGERKASVSVTPQRVVCRNTLGIAFNRGSLGMDRALRVFHRANVKSRTTEAVAQIVAELTTSFTIVARQYDALRQRFLSEEEFSSHVLDVIAPLPEKPEGERASKNRIATAAWEKAAARAQAKRDRLSTLWVDGDGHTGDHSAWESYNAAVQSIDHDADLWKVEGDSRLASLWQGQLARTKQTVLDSLYALTD
jgi:phage/plasmid-like protein (TIGR03299 family)